MKKALGKIALAAGIGLAAVFVAAAPASADTAPTAQISTDFSASTAATTAPSFDWSGQRWTGQRWAGQRWTGQRWTGMGWS
jgi:hypothetical protein